MNTRSLRFRVAGATTLVATLSACSDLGTTVQVSKLIEEQEQAWAGAMQTTSPSMTLHVGGGINAAVSGWLDIYRGNTRIDARNISGASIFSEINADHLGEIKDPPDVTTATEGMRALQNASAALDDIAVTGSASYSWYEDDGTRYEISGSGSTEPGTSITFKKNGETLLTLGTDWIQQNNGWILNTREVRTFGTFHAGQLFLRWRGSAEYQAGTSSTSSSTGAPLERPSNPGAERGNSGDGEVGTQFYVADKCEPELIRYLSALVVFLILIVKSFFQMRRGQVPDKAAVVAAWSVVAFANFAYRSCIEQNSY